MEIFKDCSTHQNNTDCIEIEIINEPEAIVCFYFNEEHTTGSMWLEKEEAIRLANHILKICAE